MYRTLHSRLFVINTRSKSKDASRSWHTMCACYVRVCVTMICARWVRQFLRGRARACVCVVCVVHAGACGGGGVCVWCVCCECVRVL